jgi:hypothetical protein
LHATVSILFDRPVSTLGDQAGECKSFVVEADARLEECSRIAAAFDWLHTGAWPCQRRRRAEGSS